MVFEEAAGATLELAHLEPLVGSITGFGSEDYSLQI